MRTGHCWQREYQRIWRSLSNGHLVRPLKPDSERVWLLSFESSHMAQLGGLGSAAASLAKALAKGT